MLGIGGSRQLFIGLSWLRENDFVVNSVIRTIEGPNYSVKYSTLKLPEIILKQACEFDGDASIVEEGDYIMTLDVASEYPRYLNVFSEEQANRMPPHRKLDHEIPLKDGPNTKIPQGVTYKMTMEEEEVLQKYLAKMIPTGKVQRSRSATAALILFVRKKGGSLRLCVDYRALNKLTIPNRYPVPHIDELHDKPKGSKWFTRLDRKNGYNLISIKPGDGWKTAFKTKLGLYEYTIMPFGLINASSSFQDMMNEILR